MRLAFSGNKSLANLKHVACGRLEANSCECVHMQERLWKRAAAKALAEAAAAAVQRGDLRASAAGADLRGDAAAAKVGPMLWHYAEGAAGAGQGTSGEGFAHCCT